MACLSTILHRLRPAVADNLQVRQGKASFDVLLTTYELMMGKNDIQRLSNLRYEYIIVDEAHRLKNASCKLNKEMKAYKSTSRLLLTGRATSIHLIPWTDGVS